MLKYSLIKMLVDSIVNAEESNRFGNDGGCDDDLQMW